MKELELWLDESGSFQPEDQMNRKMNASLVGGTLIERGALTEGEISMMTATTGSEGFAHATDFKNKESVTVVLPALKKICERGGKLVYFENRQRVSSLNNRELYLRLISKGLIQLLQQIAKDGDFKLDVYIARRIDVDNHNEIIDDEEYVRKLTLYMKEDRSRGILRFSDRCSVNFSIMSARRERRLQIADFACNARITRDSEKFDGIRSQLYELFDDEYIYSFKVETSEQRVQAMLAAGDISSAMVELYTGYGDIDHESVFTDIMERFNRFSYRLKRLHLNQFVSKVITFVRSETDFERSELIVKNILDELFPKINSQKENLQTDEALFSLNAWLLDMYLREGDIIQAKPVLEKMAQIIRSMNYRIENLKHLYLYNDRKALYEIFCLEFEKAVETMDKTIRILKNVVEAVTLDDNIRDYFGNEEDMGSEMLGDAYCMKIFAEMFLQSSDRSLYSGSLRQDTELALKQYHYEGELERTQQYRAHIEMVQGNFREALRWLLSTKNLKCDEGEIENSCVDYLDAAIDEDYLSRSYYLMYYIELMLEAVKGGDVELSDSMFAALDLQKQIKEEFLVRDSFETDIRSDVHSNPEIHKDILSYVFGYKPGVYHPVEIIHWKYALYCHKTKRGDKIVKDQFIWALDSCCPQKGGEDYMVMRITSLAIYLDMLVCLSENTDDIRLYKNQIRQLEKTLDSILDTEEVPIKMVEYASKIRELTSRLEKDKFMDPDQMSCACELSGFMAW